MPASMNHRTHRGLRVVAGLVLLACAALVTPGTSAYAQTPSGQFVGTLPAGGGGGQALVVWTGGSVDALLAAADAAGCHVTAVWVTDRGSWVAYVRGAPSFVNQPWAALYPGAMPSTAVLLTCGASATTSTPAPAPTRGATPSASAGVREVGGCPLFPDDNAWAQDISNAPRHPLSDRYIASILASGNRNLHADFGVNQSYGIPYVVVPASQPTVPVTFEYADESDVGPYPIPSDVPVEAGSDAHVLVVRQGECKLYELFAAQRDGVGWLAGAGAIFDLRSNALRPDGWTPADAAGLPILPGLVRYDEVSRGAIHHALRFTISRSQRAYIHPATHFASSVTDASAPPMGLRLRLRADFDLSRFHGQSLVILTALKRYGMFVADNGSNWFISGATNPGWNDDDLNQLKTVPGSAFEAVDTGPIVSR